MWWGDPHAEDAMGKGGWSAIELAKALTRGAADDPAFKATGRGPGSGPDATPYTVTKLLLAALADVPPTWRRSGRGRSTPAP